MAGRQREDKMFQKQASISPEPEAALSLSSRGEGVRTDREDGTRGWASLTGSGMSHKTHSNDMMLYVIN